MKNLHYDSETYQSRYHLILETFDDQSDHLDFTLHLHNSKMQLYFVVHSNKTCDIHLIDENFELLSSTNNIHSDLIDRTIDNLLK